MKIIKATIFGASREKLLFLDAFAALHLFNVEQASGVVVLG
jgi:hypothetical protein